jgi:putative selenium metabolism protein SsnA
MLIVNGTLATMDEQNRLIPDGALFIEGDRIADVGTSRQLQARYPDQETLDAEGRLVIPGLICAHTHFYGAFARGMTLPGEPPRSFPQILERLWWRLDKALDEEAIRYSALVCLVDAIRHGTTTLIDHHASPNAIDGSLDIISEATLQAGVRASLCYEVTDRDGDARRRAGVAENIRFATAAQAQPNPLLGASFGLHASLTLSDETLDEAAAAAAPLGVGFHLHVAEDLADQRDSLQRSAVPVVERLFRHGILGERTIAAHCVHVDDAETQILRQTGTRVVHNPRSNMNNAVGTARLADLSRQGIHVGLGNDGFSNNMFTEMHTAYLVHKMAQTDPRAMPADVVLRMVFAHNAEIANLFFPGPLGRLSVGALADLILVDYDPTTPFTADNLPWHIVFGVDGSGVDTTIAGGRILMRHRELLTLDEAAITARSREVATGVWRRL